MNEDRDRVVKQIRIQILQHKKTDLLMAISHDLPGLLVPGRSEEEIAERLPAAVQEILEAQGKTVVGVPRVRPDPGFPTDFMPPAYITDAVLSSA